MHDRIDLIQKAMDYVTGLMAERLPATMTFHNMQHTLDVSDAVQLICTEEKLTPVECLVVQMAAVFHDSGYLFTYSGHEEASMGIAGTYLLQESWTAGMIDEVVSCIAATKMPQNPKNRIQEVICDADMYHFTRKDYPEYAARLKTEWGHHLNKHADDLEWDKSNLAVLCSHRYFTKYAQTFWQPLKQQNIQLLQTQMTARL